MRRPDAALAAPGVRVWQAGEVWHRIHGATRAPTAFNPCLGRPTRFAPLRDATGACIPTLYAAASFDAACFETLFHDISDTGRFRTLPLAEVGRIDASRIAPRRDLRLAMLFAPELKRWRLARRSLIGSSAAHYGQTVLWAQAVHAQFPDLDGMIWTSSRCDPDLACLLFGDRVQVTDLTEIERRAGLEPAVRADVRQAARRAAIVLTA